MSDDTDVLVPQEVGAAPPAPTSISTLGPVPDGQRRHPPITEKSKDQMAQQHVLGMPISEIANLHGFEARRVSALFRTQEMQDRVEAKRVHLMDGANKVMFKFLLHAEGLAQAQVDCALSPGPDQYRARTWILERIAPARSTSQANLDVNVSVNHEVMVGLRDALKETAKVLELRPTTEGISLLDGRSAMPPSSYDMGDDGASDG